jgi:hypothetical protein
LDSSKSALEKVTDNLVVQMGGAALAVASGAWWAALLPVLTNSLANGRAQTRIGAALHELNRRLGEVSDQVKNLSDAQYRLIGGVVIAMCETVDDGKLSLLKDAAVNAVGSEDLDGFQAQVFSRILRDISVAEVAFLAEHEGRRWISFAEPRTVGPIASLENPPPLFVDKTGGQGAVAIGLIHLGLIVRSSSEGLSSDQGAYTFSPLVTPFLRLLKEPNSLP